MDLTQGQRNNARWMFSPLDKALTGLVNNGSWLYDSRLDTERLYESLKEVLKNYPVFTGRMDSPDSILMNDAGIAFSVAETQEITCDGLTQKWFLPKALKADFDLQAFKKGRHPVMSVKVTRILDGTLISVAVNHVCADGASLFRFVSDWAKVYDGRQVQPVSFDQALFPKPEHTKEDLLEILKKENWFQVGFKDLFGMLTERIKSERIISDPIFISNKCLEELRTGHSIDPRVGSHSVLSALLCGRIFKKKKSQAAPLFTEASVVNLRGRAVYPANFIGNAVMNITSPEFDDCGGIGKNAGLIDGNLKGILNDRERLERMFQLYTEAMTLKVPYLPFNVSGTAGKNPTCLLVNDFRSFGIYDLSFGGLIPVKAFPNDLPDTIKIWPGSQCENGIYLFLRGNIARAWRNQ